MKKYVGKCNVRKQNEKDKTKEKKCFDEMKDSVGLEIY